MNWKKCVIDDLSNYKSIRQGRDNIKERISALDAIIFDAGAPELSAAPARKSGNGYENHLINYIFEKQQLELNLKATDAKIKMIEDALKILNPDEKRILTAFYIDRPESNVENYLLKYEHLSRTALYQKRDKAIYKFMIAMYGIA